MPAFKVNEPSVASETIDGEVVVINLELGTYYSLQDVAAEIWEMTQEGYDVEAIKSALGSRYLVNGTDIDSAVDSFLIDLQEQKLIVPRGGETSSGLVGEGSVPQAALQQAREDRVFQAPVLNTYTDMQELLLLDPIHEVDDTGWPNIKQ